MKKIDLQMFILILLGVVTPKPWTYTSRFSILSLAIAIVGKFIARIFVENETGCGSRIIAMSFVLKLSL